MFYNLYFNEFSVAMMTETQAEALSVYIAHAGSNRTIVNLQLILIGTFVCI